MKGLQSGLAAFLATCQFAAFAFVADVTKFGAKGDGRTDDTAAVQRAIDAVAAAGGGKVYLPYTTNGYLIASRIVIEDCQFCLDDNVGDTELGKHLVENPCHTVGFHASGDQNDQQILRDVAVQGFKYGFVFGEHIVADHLYVHNCEQAVVFHDSTHLSKVGMLVAQHNRTILAITEGTLFGNPPDRVNVQIDLLNFEGGQTTGLPPYVSHLKNGIYDPGNRLHGSITWHEPWGANTFPVVGAKNFRIRRFGE